MVGDGVCGGGKGKWRGGEGWGQVSEEISGGGRWRVGAERGGWGWNTAPTFRQYCWARWRRMAGGECGGRGCVESGVEQPRPSRRC